MKIKAHVLSAADAGDELKIMAQGQTAAVAEWRPVSTISFSVPMNERSRRAFYVGREVTITVEAKRGRS